MTDTRVRGESRRSTRVALKIVISVQGLDETLTCDGGTITVNRHGALVSSSVPLRIEMKIKNSGRPNGQKWSCEGCVR